MEKDDEGESDIGFKSKQRNLNGIVVPLSKINYTSIISYPFVD